MSTVSAIKDIAPLPRHVAIIMDGNGRWAERRGLPRLEGHRAGITAVRATVERLNQYQVKYVTIYSFSTENWRRPPEEVNGLFRLIEEMVDKEAEELHRNNIRVRHLGRLDGFSASIQQAIKKLVELTRNNTGLTLGFAFNYGGRLEIVDAVRQLVTEGIPAQKIDEELLSRYLYTAGLPDVDLVIRTGGELRISNFLLWQAAYAEYYFTDVLWPDFDAAEVDDALLAYSQRRRRFGGL